MGSFFGVANVHGRQRPTSDSAARLPPKIIIIHSKCPLKRIVNVVIIGNSLVENT